MQLSNNDTYHEAPDLKPWLQDILFRDGYPDYAVALNSFRNVYAILGDLIGATDYQNIYINASLSDKEASLVVRHEILHVLLSHYSRRHLRNPLLWNIAADYELSNYYDLRDCDELDSSPLLKDGCSVHTHPEFDNLIAEEIFVRLDSKSINANYGVWSDLPKEDCSELREKLLETVKEWVDSLSEEDKQQLQDNGSPFLAAEHRSGLGGNETPQTAVTSPPPSESQRLRYSLRRYFKHQQDVSKGRTFKRPNKKLDGSGIIAKSRTNKYQQEKTLAVYIDISGSMSEKKLARAIGCCESMAKMKRSKLIKHYFNTRIETEFRRGGGTSYEIIFKHAKENKFPCIAIITDDSRSGFKHMYELESVWLVGIETGRNASYSISQEINTPTGHITAKHFDCFVVGHD